MLICQNCGKPLNKRDRAYFLFEVPKPALTEIRSFLKTNSVSYCTYCIQVLRQRTVSL